MNCPDCLWLSQGLNHGLLSCNGPVEDPWSPSEPLALCICRLQAGSQPQATAHLLHSPEEDCLTLRTSLSSSSEDRAVPQPSL